MDEKSVAFIVCAIFTSLVILIFYLRERYKTRRIMHSVLRMLDEAIAGTLTEKSFDESLLSAVESKMFAYLTAGAVTERNIKIERDKIRHLLSDISHQTKTPISNIQLYGALLAEQELTEEGKDCVKALGAQAEKLSFLISSLVKLSRLEAGVIRPYPVSGGVFSFMEEAKIQFKEKAAQKNIALNIEPTDITAVFDPKWTQEALCNILDNAIKYTPLGGAVSVSAKCYEMFCRIDVSDTGIGIAEEERAKVFARFYRSPEVREEEGAGIGLYLTREILAAQGGYIKLAPSLGGGTVFSMFLPRHA